MGLRAFVSQTEQCSDSGLTGYTFQITAPLLMSTQCFASLYSKNLCFKWSSLLKGQSSTLRVPEDHRGACCKYTSPGKPQGCQCAARAWGFGICFLTDTPTPQETDTGGPWTCEKPSERQRAGKALFESLRSQWLYQTVQQVLVTPCCGENNLREAF